MAADTIVHHLIQFLAAEGLVRMPSNGAARPLPPAWRQPADGTPEPGTKTGAEADDGVVLGVFRTGGIPAAAGTGYSRQMTIDVQYRAKAVPLIEDLAEQIRTRLAPSPIGYAYKWLMDGVTVIASNVYSELQPLGSSTGAGWTFRETYLFEVYASDAT